MTSRRLTRLPYGKASNDVSSSALNVEMGSRTCKLWFWQSINYEGEENIIIEFGDIIRRCQKILCSNLLFSASYVRRFCNDIAHVLVTS